MKGPRIAYLLKKFPRLSETFILNELLSQQALGTELHVFSRRQPDDEPRHPQLERLRAPIEYLPPSREVDPWTELFLRDDGELLQRVAALTRSGLPTQHPRLPSILSEAVALRRRCRELGIEHVHAHFATDGALLANLLYRLGGPGYSLTLHAKDIYRDTVDASILDRLVGDSRFSVTVCDANVVHLSGVLGQQAREKLRRLYNGIDLDAFVAGESDRQPNHVLAVGRLVEKKGIDVLIDALALLRDRGRVVRATIVGDGDQREALKAQVRERELSRSVTMTGPLGQDRVRDLMAHATLLCAPCRIGEDGNRDALPTVLLEALACGLPSISTPVTGIPEILDGGRVGVLVPENDVNATAQAMADMLDDPERREHLGVVGRMHVREHFDLQRSSRTLKGWFDAVPRDSREPCASPA